MGSMRSFVTLLLPLALLAAETPAKKKPVAPSASMATKTVAAKNFKEEGSANAPVTIEIYTDYQCPSCRAFYMEVLPQLRKDYIETGKVRILHRDFPLPMHQFGALAAKYANAAGYTGHYDQVFEQIFKTQPEWSQNGNVDIQVAKVLPPGDMQKVREMVKSGDPRLDETVRTDTNMGNQDRVNQTPTLEIVVRGGNRQQIGGYVEYALLKRYIDQLLAKG